MIKLLKLIKQNLTEAIIKSDHYLLRKAERVDVKHVAVSARVLGTYSREEIVPKLKEVVKQELTKRLNFLETKDITASQTHNIGYVVMKIYVKNRDVSEPAVVTVASSVGATGLDKQIEGNSFIVVVKGETAVTVFPIIYRGSRDLEEQLIRHDKHKGKFTNKSYRIAQAVDVDYVIDLQELMGEKTITQTQKVTPEELPYKVRTDYRVGQAFDHETYGKGIVVSTSSGVKGIGDSRGIVDWIDVDFKKPYFKGGQIHKYRRISNIYTKPYFDRK